MRIVNQMSQIPPATAELPPSPPTSEDRASRKLQQASSPIHEVLEIFRQHRSGRSKLEPQNEIALSPSQYNELVGLLERNNSLGGYVKEKVQWQRVIHTIIIVNTDAL